MAEPATTLVHTTQVSTFESKVINFEYGKE